jgi:tetratricopeptide (TPR) repeat protein
MPHERLRIFISAVTSEFGRARDALAADLRARGHTVTVESDFNQRPDSETMLGELADYIRDCHAVICIIGKRSGSCPPARAAERLAKALPNDIKTASYTQWEFFLARDFKRHPYIYIARADYEPDREPDSGDLASLQNAFRVYLEAENFPYGPFSNIDQLARAVFKDLPEVAPKPIVSAQPAAKPIVLPYPSIGDLFKGRDDFMRRLHESLTRVRGGRTAIASQALYGLGGIGKTRTAVEYAWAHADEYRALLFVVAETPEALQRNLAALTSVLVPQLDTKDDGARLAAVVDWLKANPGWFLILDNVDTRPALIEVERLLSGLTGGHMVLTSRLSSFSGNFQPLEFDVLALDDAAAFLLARTEGRRRLAPDDAAKVRELAGDLGGVAIMLEQAAANIAKRRLTFAQYLEQWRSKRGQSLEWFDETVTAYLRAVAVTWETSVEQLTEGGRKLLERLAWLAPEKVPESLLDVPIPGAQGENLYDTYNDLAAYSLVRRDLKGPYFTVHRLVQDVTRHGLAGEARQRSLVEALGWTNGAFSSDPVDVRNWPMLDPLVPHARIVTAHADAAGIPEPTARLMNQLGLLLMTKALYAEAEPLIRRALSIDEKSFGPEHPNVATVLNNLAGLLRATNRLVEAEPLMRRALVINEKSFGPDHPDVARNLNNLATLLLATNRMDEAEPLMRRVLAINEKSFGPDHPDIAIALNNLAALLRATNRLVEAEPLIRRALSIDEKSFGPDHPNVAIALNNLTELLRATNRLVEAEPLMRRALVINEKSFRPDHPDVATHLSNLAQLLQATNRLVEAEPLMRRVISIFENSLGPDHPNVATALNNLAELLRATNRLVEAEPLMRRALSIDEKSFGPEHPGIAIALNNLATLLLATNRMDEAEPLMRRVLAINEKSFGPEHPDIAIALNNLAALLLAANRMDEAEPLMRRNVKIFVEFTRRTGHPHPHLDVAFTNYAHLLAAMDKSKQEIKAACNELRKPLASAPALAGRGGPPKGRWWWRRPRRN